MGRRVAKTRNLGEYTEARYWGVVRSALRGAFRYWRPAIQAKINSRRTCKGGNKKQKYEYKCADCGLWFPEKEVQIDHIAPVGSLNKEEDLAPFLRNLTTENVSDFQVLCKKCHKTKTNLENKKRRKNERV